MEIFLVVYSDDCFPPAYKAFKDEMSARKYLTTLIMEYFYDWCLDSVDNGAEVNVEKISSLFKNCHTDKDSISFGKTEFYIEKIRVE